MTARTVSLLAIIPNAQWLSSNQRLHWAPKAKRTAWIRNTFRGLSAGHMPIERHVHIVAHIGYPTAAKADPANAYPSVKAAVDGCVTAGLLVEDSHEWVTGPDMRRDHTKAPRGTHTVRLEIIERSAE